MHCYVSNQDLLRHLLSEKILNLILNLQNICILNFETQGAPLQQGETHWYYTWSKSTKSSWFWSGNNMQINPKPANPSGFSKVQNQSSISTQIHADTCGFLKASDFLPLPLRISSSPSSSWEGSKVREVDGVLQCVFPIRTFSETFFLLRKIWVPIERSLKPSRVV